MRKYSTNIFLRQEIYFPAGMGFGIDGDKYKQRKGGKYKKNHGCKNAVFEWHPIIALQTAHWCSKFSFTYQIIIVRSPSLRKFPAIWLKIFDL